MGNKGGEQPRRPREEQECFSDGYLLRYRGAPGRQHDREKARDLANEDWSCFQFSLNSMAQGCDSLQRLLPRRGCEGEAFVALRAGAAILVGSLTMPHTRESQSGQMQGLDLDCGDGSSSRAGVPLGPSHVLAGCLLFPLLPARPLHHLNVEVNKNIIVNVFYEGGPRGHAGLSGGS